MKLPARRWLLAGLGVLAVLGGLLLLHPYPRQSLFGPTIRGTPRCLWEAEIRRHAQRAPSWLDQSLRWLGIQQQNLNPQELFDDADMLPLLLEMLNGNDPAMRRLAVGQIVSFRALQHRSALPALRQLLAQDDLDVSLLAGRALWLIDKDKQVFPVFLKLLDDSNPGYRALGMGHVATLAADAPELYPHIIARARDANARVRDAVMYAMMHFGKKGLPILIEGLNDANAEVRYAAATALESLGASAVDAIPALEARLKDPDASAGNAAAHALQAIDPQRFKNLKTWRK